VAATASADMRGMGFYGVAMAAGRPGWAGLRRLLACPGDRRHKNRGLWHPWVRRVFWPLGWVVCRPMPGFSRAAGDGAKTSYRAVLAQARHQAAAGGRGGRLMRRRCICRRVERRWRDCLLRHGQVVVRLVEVRFIRRCRVPLERLDCAGGTACMRRCRWRKRLPRIMGRRGSGICGWS